MAEITVAELVRNGTMSADIAGVLWAAVERRLSYLTVAIPRFAGKSTTSKAVLALRPPDMPVHRVAGEPEVMARLERERRGGYIFVEEFDHVPMYGYIWGAPVRRVFQALQAGYALQTSLHAPSVDEGIQAVTHGNGVPDDQAATFKLVLYIERFGTNLPNFWRRLVDLYEVHAVRDGRPVGQTLYRWESQGDRFVKAADPRYFTDASELDDRAGVFRELASTRRTSPEDQAAALAHYRLHHPRQAS
ncbi:MAG: hypothetical protein ACRDGF_06995 [Chloroflexota bacterium]